MQVEKIKKNMGQYFSIKQVWVQFSDWSFALPFYLMAQFQAQTRAHRKNKVGGVGVGWLRRLRPDNGETLSDLDTQGGGLL